MLPSHAGGSGQAQRFRTAAGWAGRVAEDDRVGGFGGLEGGEGVEDDGGRRKGKLNRVVADALTRLSDGTASTPRVHRLPRSPRILPQSLLFVSLLHRRRLLAAVHTGRPTDNKKANTAHICGRRQGDAAPAPRSSILADLAGTRLTSRLRAGQSVSGTEYRTTVPAYQHRTCVVRSFVPQPHPPTYATGVDIHSETLGTDVFVQTRHYRSMRRLRNSSTAETLLYPHHECCRSSLLLDTVCSTMQ